MSTISKDIVRDNISQVADLAKKEFELRKAKVEIQHENLNKQLKELEGFKIFKIGATDEKIESLKFQNREYIQLAKTGSVFLNINDFKGCVPMFARNLIFIGAETGHGKSTLTANIALQFLAQSKRVLIVTNEEHPTDVLNRIICLIKGWAYHDHANITKEQQQEFDKMYPTLCKRLEIIDDSYNGVGGLTTTIEGLKTIQSSLKDQKEKYDIVIHDYYQNTNASNKNPSMSVYDVQHEVGRSWDQFKNVYNAPIILLAQLKALAKDDDSTPFKERIEGRKSIFNFCTCAIEARANKQTQTTEWTFYKSRFQKSIGLTIKTGFEYGKYVKHDIEFSQKIEKQRMDKTMKEVCKKDAVLLADILKEIENA
jgi:replicative DNA helicase